MHLTSMAETEETTGSTSKQGISPLSSALDEEDWRRAQAALSLAVDPQGSGQPVNWDNPGTRRKGSFAPTGLMVISENTICRPFSATLVEPQKSGGPAESRLEGRACRTGPGEWMIREAHPVGAVASIGQNPAPAPNQPLPRPSAPLRLSTGSVR